MKEKIPKKVHLINSQTLKNVPSIAINFDLMFLVQVDV